MGHHQVVHRSCGKTNTQGMVDMWGKRSRPPYIHHAVCISLPTGSMNNLMMAHLQGRNMKMLLSDVDVVVLLNEYIYIYVHIYVYIYIYTICLVLLP
jgi:hypothetical protein